MSIMDGLELRPRTKPGRISIPSVLKNFTPTGKTCNWPGCTRQAYKTKLDVVSKTKHCIRHHMMKASGRVGPNWNRDRYREHMKPVCALSGKTLADVMDETKMILDALGKSYSKRHLLKRSCQQFDVDHIDGNHKNNDPSNLQTLTKAAHKLKSDECGDAAPGRYQ